MQFDLVVLPLLGGYIFTTKWHRTKFYVLRQSGYRLLFVSSISGALFLFLSLVLTHIFSTHYRDWFIIQEITGIQEDIFPFDYSGSAFLAFLLGAATWIPLNYLGYRCTKKFFDEKSLEWEWFGVINPDRQTAGLNWWERVRQFFRFCKHSKEMNSIKNEIYQSNNGFEFILFDALVNRKIVSITTDYDKVYIGFVLSTFNPGKEQYAIRLLPLVSGYRDAETRSIYLKTNYIEVFTEINEDRKQKKKDESESTEVENTEEQEETSSALDNSESANCEKEVNFEMIFNEFGNQQLGLNYQQINSINYFEEDVFEKFGELQKGK